MNNLPMRTATGAAALWMAVAFAQGAGMAQQPAARPPDGPLAFGGFVARFAEGGALTLNGPGWPKFDGTWTQEGDALVLAAATPPRGCETPGRYRLRVEGTRLSLAVLDDGCQPRRMILDRSTWRPAGEANVMPERRIARQVAPDAPAWPVAASAEGSWPSFRGPRASGVADGQSLPDEWDGKSGRNVLWRVPLPGLAHSSPVVWGSRVFVTTAISGRPGATFRPGLYGDGDASDDESSHQWVIQAIDARTGKPIWQRTAHEGPPRQKRHIKSTYASATPATNGRVVVASFGSEGVYAYDVDGNFRWSVDLGRLDVGAYDIPTFEWGTASSPLIWNDLVFLQCDTQLDSFLIALKADTGETVWKTERDELPSWGTPNVIDGPSGPELVTNASNAIRAYDPRTGAELWRVGPSSKITAPTPVGAGGLIVVASGRAPERPIFVVRAGSRGDLTLPPGETRSATVAWSWQGRGSYMPTPLIYGGIVYVLGNNGVFDAYDLASGAEIYRARAPHLGSGFSASPVAADGKIYIAGEDGDLVVLRAGREFTHIATNPMGELIMATPALSGGVMYVRTVSSLFAIGR